MQYLLDRFGSLLLYPTHFHYIWRSYFFSITYWFFPLFTFLAAQVNSNLCDKFSVGHYPMLFWGPPNKFVGGSWKPNQEKSDIVSIANGRTATLLLDWINKQLGRYTYYSSTNIINLFFCWLCGSVFVMLKFYLNGKWPTPVHVIHTAYFDDKFLATHINFYYW